MKNVEFNPNGGPMSAQITCGYSQEGAYSLWLYEANQNQIVPGYPKRGNFINTDDDVYQLPQPNQDNDKRLLECSATLVITPPIRNYDLDLEIFQDGARLGFDTMAGQTGAPTVSVSLFILLMAKP